MANTLKAYVRALCGLGVVAALAFGASAAMASVGECGDDPGEIGTCPPFTQSSCGDECFKRFMSGGQCIQGCCLCAV